MFSKKEGIIRILKLTKYRLKAQVEKDEGPSEEGYSPREDENEGLDAETLSRLLFVTAGL